MSQRLLRAPAAVVLGVLARREVRRTGGGGRALATWVVGRGVASASLAGLHALLALALFSALLAVVVAAVVAGLLLGAASGPL